MAMAATLSHQLGWISADALERTKAVIESAGLPLVAPMGMSSDDFLTRMRLDKKKERGRTSASGATERLGRCLR
ncbi:hypothetical protein DK37_11885 [Halomonas sp. SUBG004]|nr:hypothetical protein DK37_11885 [Halomonas sp. SUBG004]